MSNLQFRNANADDSEKLTALINSAYRGDQSRKGWTTEADILEGQRIDPPSVRELIAQPEAVLLMAFDGEDLVGSVFLEKKETDKAYLGMLTVKPDIQAKGTGREILLAAEEWVQKSWDVSRIEMTVIVFNKLTYWSFVHFDFLLSIGFLDLWY